MSLPPIRIKTFVDSNGNTTHQPQMRRYFIWWNCCLEKQGANIWDKESEQIVRQKFSRICMDSEFSFFAHWADIEALKSAMEECVWSTAFYRKKQTRIKQKKQSKKTKYQIWT